MDNEVTKLYENAGIRYFDINACKIDETGKNGKCNIYKYPPFTAEKQLSLIKWLLENGLFWDICSIKDVCTNTESEGYNDTLFDKILAGLINSLWQDLTESEKAEIKEILT